MKGFTWQEPMPATFLPRILFPLRKLIIKLAVHGVKYYYILSFQLIVCGLQCLEQDHDGPVNGTFVNKKFNMFPRKRLQQDLRSAHAAPAVKLSAYLSAFFIHG